MSHLGERLSALIDGELGHDQRDRVLAHLAKCEPCRLEAAALRMLKQRMRALGEATAGAALTDRLMAMAPAARPGGRSRPLPGHPPGADEPWPRWPVRSLALSAFIVLALGLPAAAFMAGGGQQQPGPSVTPAVEVFITQHAINNGAMPAGPSPAPIVNGTGNQAAQAGTGQPTAARPVTGLTQPGAAARSLEGGAVIQSLKHAISGSRAATRPPGRRDHSGPRAKRGSHRSGGRRPVTPRGG
jgi:anti-sigma factor RsiW